MIVVLESHQTILMIFFLTHYDNLDININFTTIDLQNFILEIQKMKITQPSNTKNLMVLLSSVINISIISITIPLIDIQKNVVMR